MSVIRKGTIVAFGPNNTVGLDFNDGGSSPPVPRWMFGGPTSGLHVGPVPMTDQALVLGWGNRNQPAALVPMTDHPEQLATMLAGEVLLYGPGGQVLLQSNATNPMSLNTPNGQFVVDSFSNTYFRNNTGATVVAFSNGSIALNPASGQRVSITGGLDVTGSLTVNGVTVVVP